MLALTRKKGDSIVIGNDVEIIVLSVQGEQVKLGIVAPKSVPVHRKEIFLQIQDENKEASQSEIGNVKLISEILKDKMNKQI